MYEFVNHAEVERYQKFCFGKLQSLCATLKKDGITAQPILIGSGARNLVTRNGAGAFDLDYNLEIIRMPAEYDQDPFALKNRVMTQLNKQLEGTFFSDAKDSTSVITAILHFTDTPQVQFSFDIGIIKKNKQGNYCRLIHQKDGWGHGTFTWCETPTSAQVGEKASAIKKAGKWVAVRQRYLELKNRYLKGNDRNHPSFVVYVEAVNQVFATLSKKTQPAKASGKAPQKAVKKSAPVKDPPKATQKKAKEKAAAEKAARDNRANQLNPNNKAYIGKKKK